MLWLVKGQIADKYARVLTWLAWAVASSVFAWTLSTWLIHGQVNAPDPIIESDELRQFRKFLSPGISATVMVVGFAILLSRVNSVAVKVALAAAFILAAVAALPSSFIQPAISHGSPVEIAEFADWRRKIPENSNVLMIPLPTNAIFAWITLNRPSYISVDQSSGVVFARETAMEIRRRSEVLLPIADFDWKIMTRLKIKKLGKRAPDSPPKRLTAEALVSACTDPLLGFVVAKENVGYAPLSHDEDGAWKNWNLYDCSQIRAASTGNVIAILRELGRYGMASLCALCVDAGLLWFMVRYLLMDYLLAATFSFICGAAVAYVLSISFVFRHSRFPNRRAEFAGFVLIGVPGLAVNAGVITVAVRYFGLHYLWAKGVAALATFSWNFLARRQILFFRK